MNERIQQLKQQAKDFYLLQEDLDCSTKQLHELVESKFAELIVRECADVLLEWKKEPFPLDPDFAASLIKEHFGIKE